MNMYMSISLMICWVTKMAISLYGESEEGARFDWIY